MIHTTVNWWRETKWLIGQINKPSLTSLAGGNVQQLDNMINDLLQQVSNDLSSLPQVYNDDLIMATVKFVVQPIEVFLQAVKYQYSQVAR